jgi:hypothetical protein
VLTEVLLDQCCEVVDALDQVVHAARSEFALDLGGNVVDRWITTLYTR